MVKKGISLILSLCVMLSGFTCVPSLAAGEESYSNLVYNVRNAVVTNATWSGTAWQYSNLNDGDYSTRCAARSGSTLPYIKITLSELSYIDNIVIVEANSSNIKNYIGSVSYSTDGEEWNEVSYTRSESAEAVSGGRKHTYNLTDTILAKYIEFKSNTNTNININEVEVYGKVINPYLQELTLSNGGELIPEFSPEITSYDTYVESSDNLPTVSAKKAIDGENVPEEDIEQASAEKMKATVNVKFTGEGKAQPFTVPYTVNMLLLSANAQLSNVIFSDESAVITPKFDRDTDEYIVYYESTLLPEITPVTLVDGATYAENTVDNVTTISVTSKDGSNTKDYKFTFIPTSDKLKSISVDGVPIAEFDEDITEYVVKVDNLTVLPQLSAQRKDGALNENDEPDVKITQANASGQMYQASVEVQSKLGRSKIYRIFFEKNHGYSDLTDLENVKITTRNGSSDYPISNAIDNKLETLAQAASKDGSKPWTVVELPEISYIANLAIYERMSSDKDAYFADIQYSLTGDENDWTVASVTQVKYKNKMIGTLEGRKRIYSFNDTAVARYIRVAATVAEHVNIMELEIFGKELNPYLESISLPDGFTLSQEFDAKVTEYDTFVNSPDDINATNITAVASDAQADVSYASFDDRVEIYVTTSGSEYTHTYTINKILKGTEARLLSMTLTSGELSPAFDRDVYEYTVYVTDPQNLPEISAVPLADTARVVPTQASAETMQGSVVVTSSDGVEKTYTVNFIPSAAKLKSIKVGGEEIEDFDPAKKSYTVSVSSFDNLPTVAATALYDADMETVSVTQATQSTKQATIKITSKLGDTATYTVSFMKSITQDNLSRDPNTKVIGSRGYTTGGLGNAADGAYNTMWQTNIGTTEYARITVNLPDVAKLDNIIIWEIFSASTDWWKNENIEYSVDGETWEIISADKTTYNNLQIGSYSNPGRKHVYTLSEPTYARYVRYTAPKTGNFTMIEFEVYGQYKTNNYLKSVSLSKGELDKTFNPKVNVYDVFVETENSSDLPEITAVAEKNNAVVNIINATEQTMKATVSVTNDGFTNTYTFNMVAKSKNTQLNSLTLSAGDLIPAFSRDVTEYKVYIMPDDKFPTAECTTRSPAAKTDVSYPPEDAENPQIVVTAYVGDSLAEKTAYTEYKIDLIKTSADLKTLTAGTKTLFPAFNAQHYEYAAVLEDGEALPTVTADAAYAVLNKSVTQATGSTMKASVALSSHLAIKRNYTVDFYRRKNNPNSARLTYIKFDDGVHYINEKFDPEETEYTVYVKDRQNLPELIPVTEDSEAVYSFTETADAKTLTTKIKVTAKNGQTKEYTIYYLINTAIGKTAWASSQYNGTEGSKAIDGKMDTYWNSSVGSIPQWVICNLEDGATLHKIVVHTSLSEKAEVFNVISKSNDGRNWENVPVTSKVEILPESNGYERYFRMTFSFEPFTAKYVRVTGTVNSKATIRELDLWGIPVPTVSSNAYLKNLEFSGGTLTPSFSPYITNYTISLGKNDPIPTITACEAVNEFSNVEKTDATTSTMQAQITVTAENGITKTIYSVNIDKEVEPMQNANLSSLTLSGGEMQPAFSPKNTSYTVYLAPGEEIPTIVAAPQIDGATVADPIFNSGTAEITVTAADGITMKKYTVNFVYANAELSSINVGSAILMPALTPGVYTYTAELPAGESLPIVNAVAAGDADVIITQPESKTNKAIIIVKARGSNYSKTYTLNFTFRQSLEAAIAAALDAVRGYNATNATEATDIMTLVQGVVTNTDISITWNDAFSKNAATTDSSGLVSGTLTLTLSGVSSDVQIRKTISKLSGGVSSGDGGSGGGGGGGSSNVSFGTPTIDNNAVLDAAKQENTTDKYKEVRGHWAEKEVIALSEKGIVKGNGTSFALEDTVTRAEFITMLVRACEIEILPYNNAFSDVKNSDWFAQYIEAAVRVGIAGGYDGLFNPQGTATREEAVKMLVGAYEMRIGEISHQNDAEFTDGGAISEWAVPYVQKAVAKELVKGFETGEFMPRATLTRAQAMTLIYRLIQNNAEEMR